MEWSSTAVSMNGVSKNFGSFQALNHVNLDVHQGEIVALLGPNGAGKTTAISLMLGLRKPTTGQIRIFGGNPRNPSNRTNVACMLQESNVPETLQIHETIEMFRHLYRSSVSVKEALDASHLGAKKHNRVGKLSGGEKRRLYFALCVVADPALLFLDEPTVAMDVESRKMFWDQIEAMASRGKTIVLTTHYLEEADALAQRVIVINHGQIVAEGTPQEIKNRVSGKVIRFRSSNLNDDILAGNTDIQQIERRQSTYTLWTPKPESVLCNLFSSNTVIEDLEVTGVGLEEAFLSITSGEAKEVQSGCKQPM